MQIRRLEQPADVPDTSLVLEVSLVARLGRVCDGRVLSRPLFLLWHVMADVSANSFVDFDLLINPGVVRIPMCLLSHVLAVGGNLRSGFADVALPSKSTGGHVTFLVKCRRRSWRICFPTCQDQLEEHYTFQKKKHVFITYRWASWSVFLREHV